MATVRKKAKKTESRSVAKVKSSKTSSKSVAGKRSRSAKKPESAKKVHQKVALGTKSASNRKKAAAKSLKERKPARARPTDTKKKLARATPKREKSRPARSRSRDIVVEDSAVAVEVSVGATPPKANVDGRSRTQKGSSSKTPTVPAGEPGARALPTPAQAMNDVADVGQEDVSAKKQFKLGGAGKVTGSPEIEESGLKLAKNSIHRQVFKMNEFVVYPAHGVGQIVSIEEQEVAGFTLELFVINFAKDKMTLRVPTSKVAGVGMRRLSDPDSAKKSLEILTGRPRIKRTMWSRRAQEYETKINSGDIDSIAEVVRDLYRSEAQPEQSYSERQLYEAALDRMAREIAVVQKLDEGEALKLMIAQLQKSQKRGSKMELSSDISSRDASVDEAA
jgi:CarD family transcriptional regulator